MSSEKPSFETAFDQLQASVKRLESGELSLDQSLKQFEEGVRLTRICQEHLSSAEQRVDLLMKSSTDGSPSVQPFTSNTKS
jgi:exodeoxyribonuclease VII small subunit